MNIVDVVLTGGAKHDFMGHNSDVGRRIPHPLALQLLETQEVRSSLSLGDVSCRTGKD